MNVVFSVILVVLAVIGASAVIRELTLRLFCRADDSTVMYITHISSSEGTEAEMALRSALTRGRWGGIPSVVCVDSPLDDKTRRICEGICRDYGCERLMTKEEFRKSLD